MKINSSTKAGFTVVECTIVLAIIALLAAILVPNLIRAGKTNKERRARNACIANLKLLEGAKETWRIEHKKAPEDVPTDADLYGPDKYIGRKLECPRGGRYNFLVVSDKAPGLGTIVIPVCSLENDGHVLIEVTGPRHGHLGQ